LLFAAGAESGLTPRKNPTFHVLALPDDPPPKLGTKHMNNVRALSVREFCERYGVGRSTVYAQFKAGRLRAIKVGRRTLINVADAEGWFHSLPALRPESSVLPPRGASQHERPTVTEVLKAAKQ
jgi:excisionase family DNA binding protein